MLKALDKTAARQKAGQAPDKAQARRIEQAGACLAAAASARAVQALQAASEARRASGSMARTSGRADGITGMADGSRGSGSSSSWSRARQLTQAAVEHTEHLLHSQEMPGGVRRACLASMAPATAELRFLAALQGQHELQASLDRLCTDSWIQQPFPANHHSALGGCQLSQMLCPELTTSLPDVDNELGSGQTGQQLRCLAADSATQPLQEPWRAVRRGLLHLLAAAQLQREGESLEASHTHTQKPSSLDGLLHRRISVQLITHGHIRI